MHAPHNSFETECDRLSQMVDGGLFERLRWARTEGPMLARLVELAQGAVEQREDLELTEEGSTNAIKRFVLKVHGTRVVAVGIRLDQGHANLWAEAIERSRFTLAPGEVLAADFADVDEHWMAGALRELFGRVRS
jgi:hypothetical protein